MIDYTTSVEDNLKAVFLPWEWKKIRKETAIEEFDRKRREKFKRKYGVEEGIVFIDSGDGAKRLLKEDDPQVVKKKK